MDVLGYGDDPAVEPGETAVRVFIDRAGRPEENWDSKETLDGWFKANSEGLDRLHDGLLPAIAWIEFFPDTPERQAMPDFTRVATLLGPTDLATVDALITAGVATSRAEVLRWRLAASARTRRMPSFRIGRRRSTNSRHSSSQRYGR